MPIIIPRNGQIPQSVKDTYTQDQKNKAWEYIIEKNAGKILSKEPSGRCG